ncbi:glycoside hydrolase family 19 protein [Lysobacter sp. CA199]|uniref:glycoside hydrolase family 19 protein n=1 Tax=Lysobacter sp. CA199 TaxID=3455608 RepID=UPI003F8D8BE9
MFTDAQLAAAMRCQIGRATQWQPHLVRAMTRFGITTRLRAVHFLAQLGHESLGLSLLEENLNYSATGLLDTFDKYFTPSTAAQYARRPERIANRVYASRNGNGDEASGDGWKYRGRSPIQLTGRGNYLAIGAAINRPLVDQPDLAVNIAVGSEIAAAYWQTNGLNTLADGDDVLQVSRRINLGNAQSKRTPNGLNDRIERTKRARAALGIR